MKIQIKSSEVNNFFQGEYGNLFQKEIGIDVSEEDVRVLLSSTNQTMYKIYKKLGLCLSEDENYVYWNSDNFDRVDWWINFVYNCYEDDFGLSDYEDSDELTIWEGFLDCGGDDDIDYNGSWIDSVNQFLQWLFKRDLLNNYKIN